MSSPHSVVVVDGNARDRTSTVTLLEAAGYRVRSARSFDEAKTLPAAECPDLCGRLVVGVAGNGELHEAAVQAGARGARKPFNLRELNAVAQEIFASSPPRSPAATEGR